ncbi:MAG: hypothetical protein H0V89_11575 [Deltaproteobacteria bacterium]|nr:hypothetical protein [Deltaproteobacteria bacterium]
MGNLHVCTLDVAGNGECWGFDGAGSSYPQPPPGTFVSIESYQGKTCVIDAAGLATCWWGGDDEAADVWPIPMPVVPYAQIGLGEPDGCGVSLTGEAYCWGGQIWVGPWLYPPDLNP